MRSKYKTTGCFKFFIFLLIFVPIAYFGASYYHGVDGIGQIKEWIGAEENSNIETKDIKLDDELAKEQQKKIEELEQKVKDLESELYRKSKELEDLKSQTNN